MPRKIKTIDIEAKKWYDKINGNTYFAGKIIVNYQMDTQRELYMPFEYGYDDHFEHEAFDILRQNGYRAPDNSILFHWNCHEYGIIVRSTCRDNCLKKELSQYTQKYNECVKAGLQKP